MSSIKFVSFSNGLPNGSKRAKKMSFSECDKQKRKIKAMTSCHIHFNAISFNVSLNSQANRIIISNFAQCFDANTRFYRSHDDSLVALI